MFLLRKNKYFKSLRNQTVFFVAVLLLIILTSSGVGFSDASPTGYALVFTRQNNVYFLAPWEKKPIKLGQGSYPSLDHKSSLVVFSQSNSMGKKQLVIYDLGTGSSEPLLSAGLGARFPDLASGGRRICFVRYENGKYKLFTINVSGANLKQVITSGERGITGIYHPTWSPDGSSIYFHDMSRLYIVDTRGNILSTYSIEKITGKKGVVSSESLFIPSPDNEKLIAFTRYVPGTKLFEKTFFEPNTALFTYNLDTGERKRLTAKYITAFHPAFTPGGKYIYFTGYQDIHGKERYPFKIYRIQVDGTGLKKIIRGEDPTL